MRIIFFSHYIFRLKNIMENSYSHVYEYHFAYASSFILHLIHFLDGYGWAPPYRSEGTHCIDQMQLQIILLQGMSLKQSKNI